MTRRVVSIALATPLLAVLLVMARPVPAHALAFAPCADSPQLGCAHVSVPLDRRGVVPGTVSLSVRRRLAGSAPSTDAVVGLAGGPGQAALPLTSEFEHIARPALAARDLIVFDQRGTGESGALSCPALANSGGAIAAGCAAELGQARGSYTTSDSVDDVEAIRRANGYDKLVLFGVSYGTKVALEYAERYPQHVQALVIDSVVGVSGPDPFELSTFAAIPRVLGDLCAGRACSHITPSPTSDLARLVRGATSPLSANVFDGAGHRHRVQLGRGDLLNILLAGDENPALRAALPAAVHSALHGDSAPLARLALLAAGLVPGAIRSPGLGEPGAVAARAGLPRQGARGGFDNALYLATTCEELQFPWDRNAPPSVRISQATARARALPASAVTPFDQATALLGGPIPLCLDWPDAAPPPPADGPLPAVPTLVLSGAADLRTPTQDADNVAARIPGARVVVVPHTGHSVITTDLTDCSRKAVATFFGGGAPTACPSAANRFLPTPIPPRRLSQVPPSPGVAGRPGRTLSSVLATLVDLRREVIGASISADRALPTGSRFGGLRGGSALITSAGVRLRAFSFIPGVTVSGLVPARLLLTGHGRADARLSVAGAAAARGSIKIAPGSVASGVLGGHRFHSRLAGIASLHGDWPATSALPSRAPRPPRIL